MNLQDEICRLISDIDHELNECRAQAAKASAKSDHLYQMKLRLEKCLDDSERSQTGIGCLSPGSLLSSPRTATECIPPRKYPSDLTAMEANEICDAILQGRNP